MLHLIQFQKSIRVYSDITECYKKSFLTGLKCGLNDCFYHLSQPSYQTIYLSNRYNRWDTIKTEERKGEGARARKRARESENIAVNQKTTSSVTLWIKLAECIYATCHIKCYREFFKGSPMNLFFLCVML